MEKICDAILMTYFR